MSPSPRRQRAQARERAAAAAEARRRRQLRQRRIVVGAVAAVVILGLIGAFFGIRSGGSSSAASTTTTSTTATPGYPSSGTAPPPVAPGATLTGDTPCPPTDGSAERTTMFETPPPLCIDPTRFYTAVMQTSKGPITFQLNPERAPETVNDFVVLSRYHFYDGQPVTTIQPRAFFRVGNLFSGEDAEDVPGFVIPDEVPPQGQIFTPGTIAMAGTPGEPGTNRGELLIATFEDAPGIDQGVTSFGIMLDGNQALAAIDAAASASGEPTEVITIESVTITEGTEIPQ